jgi:hypothetical protein
MHSWKNFALPLYDCTLRVRYHWNLFPFFVLTSMTLIIILSSTDWTLWVSKSISSNIRLVTLLKLIYKLGSTNSGSINVHLKPFSTSIFSFFHWIIATVPKICTKENSKSNHFNSSPFSSRITFTRYNIIHLRRINFFIKFKICCNGYVSTI